MYIHTCKENTKKEFSVQLRSGTSLNKDTTEMKESALIKEESFLGKCMVLILSDLLYIFFREVSSFESCPLCERFHWTNQTHTKMPCIALLLLLVVLLFIQTIILMKSTKVQTLGAGHIQSTLWGSEDTRHHFMKHAYKYNGQYYLEKKKKRPCQIYWTLNPRSKRQSLYQFGYAEH